MTPTMHAFRSDDYGNCQLCGALWIGQLHTDYPGRMISTERQTPMFERIQFAVVSSYSKMPDERIIVLFDTEEAADKSAAQMTATNPPDGPLLGRATYRVAQVRITELDPSYLDHAPLV